MSLRSLVNAFWILFKRECSLHCSHCFEGISVSLCVTHIAPTSFCAILVYPNNLAIKRSNPLSHTHSDLFSCPLSLA